MYSYDPERISYFAVTDYRGKRTPFGIKAKDRLRHMYVIGKTGMGKSTLLENLAIQDIQNGDGMCFIDPHGSTAEKLLDYVPKDRVKDVIYLAPFDMDYPIGFNVMEDVGYEKRHLVVAGLMSAFRRIWVDSWSSRMEYILQNTLLALLEYPDTTLIDVNRMYVDKNFRKKVVDNVKDPLVKAYWTDEFTKYTDRYTQEATPAIQNKIGQFTGNPLVRNIIGQPKSTINIRKIMDERKILIVNLSKGRIGEQNADMLGSIITTKLYLEAMGRAELSAEGQKKLPPFYLFVDEFQSVVNESFANILSEARKYKLALTIAHQYIEQVDEDIRAAVFGNAGTIISFRVGPFDAEVLKTIFEPTFTTEDIVNLGFAQIYLTLMVDGVATKPFSARTLPPIDPPPESYKEEAIAFSRKTYGVPRAQIEEIIRIKSGQASKITSNQQNNTSANKNQDSNTQSKKSENKKNKDQDNKNRVNEKDINQKQDRQDNKQKEKQTNKQSQEDKTQKQNSKNTSQDDITQNKKQKKQTLDTNQQDKSKNNQQTDKQKNKKDKSKTQDQITSNLLKEKIKALSEKQNVKKQNTDKKTSSELRQILSTIAKKENMSNTDSAQTTKQPVFSQKNTQKEGDKKDLRTLLAQLASSSDKPNEKQYASRHDANNALPQTLLKKTNVKPTLDIPTYPADIKSGRTNSMQNKSNFKSEPQEISEEVLRNILRDE